ncbi:MAG: site-specific integrase [Betaproteobacteria bacterium]|nr:site-specific integrase [Betaproteobacteria bacterium]
MPFVIVNGRVKSDNTGVSREMPVLLFPQGEVLTLIDYCLSKRRSISWQEKLVRAAKLFLEYLEVNVIQGEEEWRLFRNFANALIDGTIDRKTQEDPSGLYWQGLDVRDANYIITLLSDFLDWLASEEKPRAAKFNPRFTGNTYDQRIEQQAYQYKRSKAFLGHAWSSKQNETGRLTEGERTPKVYPSRPPMFPEDRFEELLFKGFKVAGKNDYRGMLITLLLFGAGLRVSEPFHLYTADVQPHWEDPSQAFVAVHHPSLGIAPNHWRNRSGQRGSRDEYLAVEFGLTPRHKVRGKFHAGWKHPALDHHWFMQVHWLPEIYGQWFLQIWTRYMEQVASIPRHHPYAWVNLDRGLIGGIYTISTYNKALEAAVERIGLVFGKTYGTTAHGPRHAFAQRARRGGIDEVIRQRIMHHCSPDSQKVYTQPELREAVAAIRNATNQLRENNSKLPTPPLLARKLAA